jgi:hypothetical protein
MKRAIVTLLAGGFIGAVVTYRLAGGELDSAPQAAPEIKVSEKLRAYREAAATNDVDALAASVIAAAAEPASAQADLVIDARLSRLAALDAARAVDLALSLELDEPFVVSTLQSLAVVDVDSALGALSAIGDASLRRRAALGLLDGLGDGAASVDRIVAALPESDRTPFRIEWLAWRAEVDPAGAFGAALDWRDAAAQRRALLLIADHWARQDPRSAMAATTALPESLRADLLNRVSESWARFDAAGFMAYLETTSEPQEFSRAILWIAVADPARSVRIAERLSGDLGEALHTVARGLLAQRDPAAAEQYLESLPPGREREELLIQTAAARARDEPDAALGWLESQPGVSGELQALFYSTIIQAHPERAGEWIERLPAGVDVRRLSVSAPSADSDQGPMLALVDSLIKSDDERASLVLADLAFGWTQQNTDTALRWIEANSGAVDALFLGNAARGLAARDPVAAANFVERLPPTNREEWMLVVAEPYARADARSALSWIARYQGQTGYESAMTQVVARAAQSDPQTAAALVAQASAEAQASAAPAVASAWAGRDPAAAAQWAQGLGDPRARSSALTAAISIWSSAEAGAAERFALTMPRGDLRDQALSLLLSRAAATGRVDRRLLDGFSADVERQRVLVGLMLGVARRDADEARSLLDDYISDATLRQQAERYIAAAEAD